MRCLAAKSFRRWIAACSMRLSSTTQAPIASSVSRTFPRSACCRAFTRTPNSSRSCSTSRNTMRCPRRMRAIIENAVEAASADMSWKAVDRYSKDYIEMQTKQGVKFYRTPTAILQQQLTAYDQAAAKKIRGESAVQRDRSVAACVRRARGAVGSGYQRQSGHGVSALLWTKVWHGTEEGVAERLRSM